MAGAFDKFNFEEEYVTSQPVGQFSKPMTLAEVLQEVELEKEISSSSEAIIKELVPFDPGIEVQADVYQTMVVERPQDPLPNERMQTAQVKKYENAIYAHPMLKYKLVK